MAEHDTVWTAVSALLRAQVSEAVWQPLGAGRSAVPGRRGRNGGPLLRAAGEGQSEAEGEPAQ
ncbi:MAG: hypothetical protein ACKO3L_07095, partial [Actinomycetota bacterium]